VIQETEIIKYVNGQPRPRADLLIQERRVNIFVNGSHYISLMCLPQHLEELAAGFLFCEGLIGSRPDVQKIDASGAQDIYVELSAAPAVAKTAPRVIVSGFAQGSVTPAFLDCANLAPLTSPLKLSPPAVVELAARFNEQSELFRQTGAVHSCSLILPDGTNLFYEDIGRHNALDKIAGKALLDNLCLNNVILLTSGRISAEMLLKTAKLGIPILISVSAPTNRAVEIAKKINMTLVGFARGDSFNVYAGAERIK
jgi:FdhD protein